MPSSDKRILIQTFALIILAPRRMHLVLVLIILFCFPNRALGIGLFILVLAILLIFGCWYYKRRSGYKSLRVSMATHFLPCYYFDNILSSFALYYCREDRFCNRTSLSQAIYTLTYARVKPHNMKHTLP